MFHTLTGEMWPESIERTADATTTSESTRQQRAREEGTKPLTIVAPVAPVQKVVGDDASARSKRNACRLVRVENAPRLRRLEVRKLVPDLAAQRDWHVRIDARVEEVGVPGAHSNEAGTKVLHHPLNKLCHPPARCDNHGGRLVRIESVNFDLRSAVSNGTRPPGEGRHQKLLPAVHFGESAQPLRADPRVPHQKVPEPVPLLTSNGRGDGLLLLHGGRHSIERGAASDVLRRLLPPLRRPARLPRFHLCRHSSTVTIINVRASPSTKKKDGRRI